MQIRDAVLEDIAPLTAIYNGILTTSTAIYSDQPVTVEDRIAWWQARTAQGYPVLVSVEHAVVTGFATFGDFRTWPGYRYTVEGTIHVHLGSRGKGVGTALLRNLIHRAQQLGKHAVVAGVDSSNTGSLRFLERSGFRRAGYLPEVGFKFNRFLDLVLLHYLLPTPATN